MIVVGGSASKSLSGELASTLGAELAEIEIKRFPDTECYVRLNSDVKGKLVVVVQNTYPDANAVELFLLQNAARNAGAEQVVTVVPYYGYARQDKLFREGESVSASAMARHVQLGCDKVVTVDIHDKGTLSAFNVPVIDVSGMPALAHCLSGLEPDVILSPDKGAVGRAKEVADILGVPWDHMEKTRLDGSTVEMKAKSLDVQGKKVAITDDIIATGGTIVTATKHLIEQGAVEVYAACTHGLFTSNALDRLGPVCTKVISTDTLENETSVCTVAGEVAKALM